MNTICILGATGMLGQDMVKAFDGSTVLALGSKDVDLKDLQATKRTIEALSCDAIINCAAYTQVDKAEEEEELATLINAEAVGVLGEIAKHKGIPLVHFSTDYVFDGTQKEGYLETDPIAPINAYGRSKALGEHYLQQLGGQHFILRTAWLYALHGHHFIATIRRLLAEKPELTVVNDQWGSPTWTRDLVQATKTILTSYDPGIYHASSTGSTTWHAYATTIATHFQSATPIYPTSSANYKQPAKRPTYSMLRNTKGPALPHWEEALAAYFQALSQE